MLCFLDHPPMVAWFIRFGTAIFGDTTLGVRFAGILAMLATQLLLADIVRRVTHDFRAVVLAIVMPEAALYYGLLMAKVSPDIALIPFAVAMLWALVRLTESGDGRWWLAAGAFGGLALLSKFTAVMLLPAVGAFMLVPDWRRRWLRSPYPWLAALIAVVAVLAGPDLERRTRLGDRSASSPCAPSPPMNGRCARSATSSACSSGWSDSSCCPWCCRG